MALDLDRFKRTLIYEARGPVAAVRADLEALRAFDADVERRQAQGTRIGCAGLIGIVAGVSIIKPASASQNAFLAAVGLAAVGLIAAVVGFVRRAVYKRINLENRRYELLGRVLALLEKDMRPDADVAVKLDLRPASHAEKLARKGKAGDWNVSYYTDRWLTLVGRLVDGTRYTLVLLAKVQARSRWARGRSGKMKYKTKSKGSSDAILRLKVKPDRYRHLADLAADARSAVQLPAGARVKAIQLEPGAALLRVAATDGWDDVAPGNTASKPSGAHLVAMMFVSLYQVLNLSRAIDRP
jgi:hypothetical protein